MYKILGIVLIAFGVFLGHHYFTHQTFKCKPEYTSFTHTCAGNAKPTCLYVGIPSILLGLYLLKYNKIPSLKKVEPEPKPEPKVKPTGTSHVIIGNEETEIQLTPEQIQELKKEYSKPKPKPKSIQAI